MLSDNLASLTANTKLNRLSLDNDSVRHLHFVSIYLLALFVNFNSNFKYVSHKKACCRFDNTFQLEAGMIIGSFRHHESKYVATIFNGRRWSSCG